MTQKVISLVLFTGLCSVMMAVACANEGGPPDTGDSASVLPPTATATPPSNEFAIVGQPEPFLLEDLALTGLDGWINSDELVIHELVDANRLVLLDFWTYTCVNCVRTFGYLSAWHDAYSEHGLTIIGIHSPEFEFEKIPENVEQAVARYQLEYPIALDSEKSTWDKYGNHFWPSKYLIDQSESVVFRHFGEGGYRETESIIRDALEANGSDLAEVEWTDVEGAERAQGAHTVTRELYGGYSKNYLSDGLYAGQDAYYQAPDASVDYIDDGTRRHGQFFLGGNWLNEESAIVSKSVDEEKPSHISFEFFATSVNAVLSSSSGPHTLIGELDGKPLTPGAAGTDVSWNDRGDSEIVVDEARLYQIVELPEFGTHELKLKTNSEGLAVYSVTFGVNEFGP